MGTMGEHLARQNRGINAFLQGVKDAKAEKNKMVLEDLAMIAGTMAVTEGYIRYRNAKKLRRR